MIGAMNRRAALLEKTQTDDGGGGYAESWSTVDTVWAALSLKSASTTYTADKLFPKVSVTVTIRRRTDITSGWRITMDDRTLDVNAISDPGPQSATIILSCTVRP